MRYVGEFFKNALLGGVLVILPVYLAVLLVLKGMQSVGALVRPLAALVPDWLPAQQLLSLLLFLAICFVVGLAVRTPAGLRLRQGLEKSLFDRIPGYALLRSMTQRLGGREQETAWQPALVEIEEGLVPGFVIEECADGRITVFVPSVPTPFAGAVYILDAARVHPLDVPFTQAIRSVSRWGAGSAELLAAMQSTGR